MFQLIGRILLWLRGGSFKLLILAGVILLVWGITSPVGTLVWWVNQGADSLGLKKNRPKVLSNQTLQTTRKFSQVNCYIIFLPGVGDFSADELTSGESYFLNHLVKLHPNCVAVKDVFPYSAENKGLGGQRLLSPLWRLGHQATGWRIVVDVLVKIRNLWRFAISADPRYGQIYNQGIASAIIERMNAVQLIPQSHQPLKVILLGTSGGVEVALGASPYLKERLEVKTKIIVVSIGGVFNGKGGFETIEHFYHLRGRRDPVEDIGGIVFPSRWLWNVGSPFNQARQQGRYTARSSGNHTHDGPQGYFGEQTAGEKSKTYVDLTLQQVNQLPIWSLEQSPPPN